MAPPPMSTPAAITPATPPVITAVARARPPSVAPMAPPTASVLAAAAEGALAWGALGIKCSLNLAGQITASWSLEKPAASSRHE